MKAPLTLMAIALLGATPIEKPAPPMTLEFALYKEGESRPLVEGKMPLRPDTDARFEQQSPRSLARVGLGVMARPRGGTIALDVKWEEVTAEGERVSWTPTVDARPGEPATANIAWASGGRTLKVTVR